jgi:hypothetical protein
MHGFSIFVRSFKITIGGDEVTSIQGPSIRKKNDDFIFCFLLVRTTTKSIQFINKPVFLFWFFPCCVFGFISKAATTKIVNLYTISV